MTHAVACFYFSCYWEYCEAMHNGHRWGDYKGHLNLPQPFLAPTTVGSVQWFGILLLQPFRFLLFTVRTVNVKFRL